VKSFRVVLLTIAGTLFVVLGFCYLFGSSEGLSARKKPSDLEYAVANFAMRLSIPSQARRANNPLRPDPTILLEAKAHFKEHCAVCHGEDGTGKTELAAGLSPEVPDLRADHIQKLSDGELFYIIQNGVRFTGMPGWDFEDKHNWSLVLFIRQLATAHPQQNR